MDYKSYLARKRAEFGDIFDPDDLAENFIPYFESGQHIEVTDQHGNKAQGYVEVTTGWKPAFILVYNRRGLGGSWILRDTDTVTREFDTFR